MGHPFGMAPTAHVPLDDLHLLLIHYLYEARLPASLATLAAETGVRAALAPAGLSDALRSGDWAAAVAALAPPTTLPEPLVADIAEAAYLHLVDGGVGGGTSGTAAVELLATAAPLRRLRTSDPVRHAALVALPATLARARAAAATPSSSSIPSVSVYDLPGWGPAPAERGPRWPRRWRRRRRRPCRGDCCGCSTGGSCMRRRRPMPDRL
ncbi:hypothetical protein MMPV_009962 [Pyropia vietnamensis]